MCHSVHMPAWLPIKQHPTWHSREQSAGRKDRQGASSQHKLTKGADLAAKHRHECRTGLSDQTQSSVASLEPQLTCSLLAACAAAQAQRPLAAAGAGAARRGCLFCSFLLFQCIC